MADKSYEIEIKTTSDTSGVTSVKDQLTQVKQEAEETENALKQAFSEATAEVDRLENALMNAEINGDDIGADILADELAEARDRAEELEEELLNFDSTSIQEVSTTTQETSDIINDATENTENLGITITNIDPSVIDQLRDSMQGYTDSAKEGSDSTNILMEGLASGGIATGLAGTFMGLADATGSYNDSMLRMGLALEGHAMTVEEVSAKYGASVSKMADTTGRSAGDVRTHFTNMAIAGVKNSSTLESSFQAIANGSFYSGESIEATSNKFQRMVMSGMALRKQLASLGLSMEDLASTMGVSADEVSDKFKNMTAEQRASVLSMASSNKYGTDVNGVFKESWEGLWVQFDKAKAGLERLVGGLILPYLIPAVETATTMINGLSEVFKVLPQPVKDVFGGILLLMGGITTLGLGLNAVMKLGNLVLGPFKSIAKLMGIEDVESAKKLASTLKSNLGSAFNTLKTNISGVATTIKTNLISAFRSVSSFMSTQLLPALRNAGTSLLNLGKSALTSGLNALRSGAMWLVNKARVVATTVANWGATASQWALNVAMSMNPITIVVLAILGLIAVLGYLYFNNEQVRGAIDGLGQTFIMVGQIIYTSIINAINWVVGALQNFYSYVMTLGGLLPEGVNVTGNQIIDSIIAFLGFFATLPIQVGIILINTIARVLGFGNNFVQNMISAGVRAVSNFANQISQLPNKLSAELNNMLSLVGEWASTLPQKFWDAGVQAVQNFLNALGIHSPGIMQTKLLAEMEDTGARIPDASKGIVKNVARAGENIVEAFGDNDFGVNFDAKFNNLDSLKDIITNGGNQTINLTLEIGSVDDDKRVQQIVDIIRRELSWNNTTAGRGV